MSLPATLPRTILDTILAHLAILFRTAAGDDTAARNAARQMLAAYQPETAEELSLAAEIVSFSFHALEALGQAADPELSLSRTMRLRGSPVSLSREAHKSQRKLDKLQQARRAGTQPRPAQTEAAQTAATQTAATQPAATQTEATLPRTEPAPALPEAIPAPAVRPAMQAAQPVTGSTGGKISYAQAPLIRMSADRLTKKARKAAAKRAHQIARANAAAAAASPPAA